MHFALDKPIHEALTGVWEGDSQPYKPGKSITRWTCTLVVEENFEILGHGLSLWKDYEITFRLVGHIDLRTGAFEIFKTHQGKYTNTIVYKGIVDFKTLSLKGEYRYGRIALRHVAKDMAHRLCGIWTGDSTNIKKGEVTEWCNCQLNFSSFDKYQPFMGIVDGNGFSRWRGNEIPFTIKGDFDIRSKTVNLTKNHVGYKSTTYNLQLDSMNRTLSCDSSNFFLRLHQHPPDYDNVTAVRRDKYKMFLLGVLASDSISLKQQEACTKFRREYNITEQDHVDVLGALGKTSAEFARLSNQNINPNARGDDDCKICFDMKINCVILPCGHLCICMNCSRQLSKRSGKCPVCRGPIQQAKQVYNS